MGRRSPVASMSRPAQSFARAASRTPLSSSKASGSPVKCLATAARRRVVRTTTSDDRAARLGSSAAACSLASSKRPVSTSTSTRQATRSSASQSRGLAVRLDALDQAACPAHARPVARCLCPPRLALVSRHASPTLCVIEQFGRRDGMSLLEEEATPVGVGGETRARSRTGGTRRPPGRTWRARRATGHAPCGWFLG